MPISLLPLLIVLFASPVRAQAIRWDAGPLLTPSAAPQWVSKSSGRVVAAQGRPDGLALPVPKSPGAERLVWEIPATFAFRPGDCLEVELSCDQPQAVQKVLFYLGQGKGWRVVAGEVLHRGWNRWLLPLSSFSAEGDAREGPCDRLRIALTPDPAAAGTILLQRLRVVEPEVALVVATAAAVPAADRTLSRRTAQFLSAWLSDAGVAHAVVSESEALVGPVPRALVLPAHPRVSPALLAFARSVAQRGGKVVVAGSEDAELAAWMGLERPSAKETRSFGTFAAFVLPGSDGADWLIHDHNWRITPAKPRAGQGKVLALWRDARGQPVFDSALSATARGWWFAFPFHAGDQRRKQELLLRGLGEAAPAVWPEAARTRLARALRAGPWLGVEEVRQALRQAPDARRAAAESVLSQAVDLESSARAAFSRGLPTHAYAAAARLEARLDHAYALAQSPGPRGEMRGVWDHHGVGLYPGGWDATCAALAEAGFTAVFPNLMWSGKAHYVSRQIPASKTCEQFGDQLRASAEAARRHGLELHVWKVCWQLGGTDSPLYETFRQQGRLQVDAAGTIQPWLCPSQTANLNWEVAAISEVARHPGVTGIHLDYVRYPEGGGCFCPHTRTAYEKWREKPVGDWPREAAPGGPLAREFARFRADEISRFVGRVRSTLRGAHPQTRLSAAVFGKYPQCVDSVAQDWARWLREETVDFLTPMNYTADPAQFARWLAEQAALDNADGRILPGLGLVSTECELAPDELLQQIAEVRRRKLPGYVVFRLDGVLMDRALPYLRLAQ
jgi:uncharacterized lipoprotein YddW (UPF0748 family)